MKIDQEWTEFKSMVATKVLSLQYEERDSLYKLWACDGPFIFCCVIRKEDPKSDDQVDFEDNYKSSANQPVSPVDEFGRVFTRAESRPLNMTTYFTSVGDSTTNIGDGQPLIFDFNNNDDEVEDAPSGYRRKMVMCTFIDTVRLKEGTIYWENMPFGSYIDLCLAVPDQGWYLTNTGAVMQNTTGEPLRVARFVKSSPMMGSCPMGDELNTETASYDIPAGTIFGFTVTVPSTVGISDNVHGAVQMELYRERTVVLADE